MITVSGIKQVREQVRRWRFNNEEIAFVPTMGNLHAGHIALVRQAKRLCPRVIVSIFVNPLQFGPNEDFASYPRTLHDDAMLLADEQVDVLFTPDNSLTKTEIRSNHTIVKVPNLADQYCGEFRPGFFAGVTTIVAKLFNIVMPDIAVFGEKDYQQLLCVRQMVDDLFFPITIHSIPTVRETDGLAMSSRNQYLDNAQRELASTIYQNLIVAKHKILNDNEFNFAKIELAAIEKLTQAGFRPDYFSICDAKNLQKAQFDTKKFVILTAAHLGSARLIDNIQFKK